MLCCERKVDRISLVLYGSPQIFLRKFIKSLVDSFIKSVTIKICFRDGLLIHVKIAKEDYNMDLFNKATKVAREVGNSVVNAGNVLSSATREQTELANLKIQKSALDRKMESQYAEIGKRYIAYISNTFNTRPFDVQDVLEAMQPNLEKLSEIDSQIADKERVIKENNAERDKKRAQEQYEGEKKKLDKARELDVITEEEYQVKLTSAQKKLDNFDLLRKVEMQYDMEIITKEEYEEKVKNILQ